MMRKWIAIFLVFLFPALLKGNAFFEDADPALFHHVNVVTGDLNLTYEDVSIGGVVPYTVPRTYSSSGFSPYYDEVSERKKELTESPWIFRGGWTLLAHGNLHLQAIREETSVRDGDGHRPFYSYSFWPSITEKDGSTLDYFIKGNWLSNGKTEYLPSGQRSQKSPHPNPHRNPLNNRLILEETKATLIRSDGSEWHYTGDAIKEMSLYESHYGDATKQKHERNWRLDLEVLPSKHRVVYQYDEANWLKRIEVQNPAGNKVFGSFDFDHERFEEKRKLKIRTSEGTAFEYAFNAQHKKQFYLDSVTSPSRPSEQVCYQSSGKGKGLRIETVKFDDCAELGVTYYQISEGKKEKRKKSKKDRPSIEVDRVHHLLLPDPETGELIPFAEFTYQHRITEVHKSDGGRIVYHYRNKYLLVDRIEYFDAANNLHSEVLLDWEEDIRLKKKILRDGSGNPILSKKMQYDKRGNLTEEILKDYRQNKQTIVRSFSYYKENNLLEKEVSPTGVAIHYTYLPGTDLVHKKETIAPNGELIYREITEYNEDHLPIKVILDDVSNERHIQIFERDSQTGRVQRLINVCTDFDLGMDQWIDIHSFTYNVQGKVETETVTYHDESSYTLYYSYDDKGNLIKQTTPSGRESTFRYDRFGRKIEAKEVGKLKQTFTYDRAGHLRTSCQGEKTTHTYYDQKGCLLSYIDPFGNRIEQKYNSFGKNVKTHYPSNVDSEGERYDPIIETRYDVMGNPTITSNSLGETTSCTYDILGNVLTETDPEGNTTRYLYNQAGSLTRINHPDHSATTFTYDPLQRKSSKKIYNPSGELLSEEYWSYDSFHLLAYTDPMGLTTTYRYDYCGRKIEENAEGRVITYTYDARGNLQSVTKNGATSHMVYNDEGEILEQWEEDQDGKIENWMSFTYNEEGRKVSATRQTSEGEAYDTFEYDEEGRLICHRDPLGACTEIHYQSVTNSLGQTVQQKKTLDPLGNQTIELDDANGHLVLVEKTDSNGTTLAKEERVYDRAGNLARRIISIYNQSHPIRTYQTEWRYNQRGFPIQEIEEGKKTTLFEYDCRGNIVQKTDPRGVTLKQSFDALGRLVKQQSSDETVHNTFLYQDKGKTLVAKDHIHGRIWKRIYNRFGELISEETPHGAIQTWTYDNAGRCILHTLPDGSSIAYAHSALHMDQVIRQSKQNEILYRHTYSRFDENGHVAEEECIHSLGTLYTHHDLLERPKSTTTPWHRASINYGPSGLVTRRENSFFHDKDYQYDPLNQLTKEGVKEHRFDSLGNPLDQAINSFNQITHAKNTTLLYDASGNLKEKLKPDQVTKYRYDALNRLIQIDDESKVTFEYDPFSRLYAKITNAPDQPTGQYFYLFDQDQEIGLYNKDLQLIQLKVVGLGLREDVGGAVAIEANDETYVPLWRVRN
ncbi:MAG: putative deoxyribonuclease RhsC [Chlamydiae bacterium]|nr:putative deoxyribonuclease RhsC [Chlamydiota bacterium]